MFKQALLLCLLLPLFLPAMPAPTRQAELRPASSLAVPLQPLRIDVSVPGISGNAELSLRDSRGAAAGSWRFELRDGKASLEIRPLGALGLQLADLHVNGNLLLVDVPLFTLDAQTGLQTGQPRFDTLYPLIRGFLEASVTSYSLSGQPLRGYRSPDNPLLWLRDHTYQARGFRYFETDLRSLIDAFRQAQRPDGSFPDFLDYPALGAAALRMEVEADVEYLFVIAVYEAWQASGDDAWMQQQLPAIERGLAYLRSDPLRWEASLRLVKRPYTIDTWDFEVGPATIDPGTGQAAPRHWIDAQTSWGIFHGDNTGLAYAHELLARLYDRLGRPLDASRQRMEAIALMARLNTLSWNGNFFTHNVPLQPRPELGVDESSQLSLSNTLALNRSVLAPIQARRIVEEYFRRWARPDIAFQEWYSIDPPFPEGIIGMAGRPGGAPGEYVNGGIMPLTGGELARGAFEVGAERYGINILERYSAMISSGAESYLWYRPDGRPGISGPNTIPTDGWGSSAMLGALFEGLAGVRAVGSDFQRAIVSPRWVFTPDIDQARVTLRFAAGTGYLAYQWQRNPEGQRLLLSSSAQSLRLRLLLPEGVSVARATLQGRELPGYVEFVFGSHYLVLDLPAGSAELEISYSSSLTDED